MSDRTNKIIDDALSEPRKAEIDGQSVENHSLGDVVKALEYADRKRAASSLNGGVRVSKIRGNSAV